MLTWFGWVLFSMSGGILGSFVTKNNIKTWYEKLRKPKLAPPNWVFGPVWTTLYIMMGTSASMIYNDGGFKSHPVELGMYFLQLLLNFIWTPLFFGSHLLALSLLEIVCLWFSIATTTYLFYQIEPFTLYLLLPYLAWTGFAGYLNFEFWKLN